MQEDEVEVVQPTTQEDHTLRAIEVEISGNSKLRPTYTSLTLTLYIISLDSLSMQS